MAREPPPFVSGSWIHAAFTPPAQREAWMHAELALSDALVDEMIAADLIVIGVPMYNFNVPASLKAYIDQVVRVGRTFGFDRTRPGKPYWPLLSEQQKRLVILSSRGDHGYGYGEENFSLNHTEPSIQAAFAYMGVQESYRVAVDYDEFGGTLLGDSLARAEAQVDELVQALAADRA
ncbi:MAG: dehydrogenase [Myxococcaceae bacterium]|nr:dehydrogenase [Myxococcaceae bacterium]